MSFCTREALGRRCLAKIATIKTTIASAFERFVEVFMIFCNICSRWDVSCLTSESNRSHLKSVISSQLGLLRNSESHLSEQYTANSCLTTLATHSTMNGSRFGSLIDRDITAFQFLLVIDLTSDSRLGVMVYDLDLSLYVIVV